LLGRLFNKKPKPFIDELSSWLEEHYKVKAKKIKHKRSFKRLMMNRSARIEFIYFTLEDGRNGRAFYSPFIQVFLDIDTKGVRDEDLLVAHGGWLFLSSGLKDNFITKDFKSHKQRREYLEYKKLMGLEEIKIIEQYKIGHSEIFVIEGVLEGYKTRCAGNAEVDICFDEMTDYFHIPTVYFLLGEQVFRTDKLND
jgi:hypothetical protein